MRMRRVGNAQSVDGLEFRCLSTICQCQQQLCIVNQVHPRASFLRDIPQLVENTNWSCSKSIQKLEPKTQSFSILFHFLKLPFWGNGIRFQVNPMVVNGSEAKQ